MAQKLFFILTAILALFSAAVAFTVPKNQTEGVYIALIDDDGNEVHSKVGEITPGPVPPEVAPTFNNLTKRTTWPYKTSPRCSQAPWLPMDDFYNRAWNIFYSNCWSLGDTKIRGSLYSHWGGAVAYMCSYSAGGSICRPQEWVDAVNWVSNSCHGRSGGWMEAGWLSIPGWYKTYGYANSATPFC